MGKRPQFPCHEATGSVAGGWEGAESGGERCGRRGWGEDGVGHKDGVLRQWADPDSPVLVPQETLSTPQFGLRRICDTPPLGGRGGGKVGHKAQLPLQGGKARGHQLARLRRLFSDG